MGMSVCVPVRTFNSKTIASIDLMFFTQQVGYYTSGSVLLSVDPDRDPDLDWIIDLRTLHN